MPVCLLVPCFSLIVSSWASVITVNTTNNVSPGPGETSLVQALSQAQSGDTIQFNIPGADLHYLPTPPNGYPYIMVDNLTIDGYSQPGSLPNTNSILQPNSAKIKVVLDSRNQNYTSMNYTADPSGDSPGYGRAESTILGVVDTVNFHVRGLAFLGAPVVDTYVDDSDPSNLKTNYVKLYSIALALNAGSSDMNAHIEGCWFGVDPADGKTVAPPNDGITGFGNSGINNTVIGVEPNATNAPAQFNVFAGQAIPIIIEGDNTRISGNFLGVLPDGLHDYIVSFAQNSYLSTNFDNYGDLLFEGNIELGDHTTAIIGTDGDGVNDANERNVFGGVIPNMVLNGVAYTGYGHNIEFYGGARSGIIVAGNYVGVGIDGTTRFTNGVPALNASGGSGVYRFGSDFDGVSDAIEGNVVFNNWPPNLFSATGTNSFASLLPDNLNFFDELSTAGSASARGNVLVNNLPFPVSPTKTDGGIAGAYLTNYLANVLADVNNGIVPVLSTNSSVTNLVGTVPIASGLVLATIIDLYIPDSEGMANGQAASIPELPDGFVQGRTYLGSFVVDGPNDLDPVAGAFRFDLSGIDLKGAELVTITANYSRSPVGTHNADVVTGPFSKPFRIRASTSFKITTATRNGSTLLIGWTGGTGSFQVQKRSSLSSPWGADPTAVYSGNSATVTINGAEGYYRIQGQ